MSDLCVIKGSSKGIQLFLDSECDFMDLVTEICTKFMQNRQTFGNVEIILELLGRELSPMEVRAIVESIELNSDVKVMLLHEGDKVKDAKTRQIFDRFYYEKAMENAKIVKESVASGTTINCDYSILILGDVKEGAHVASKGNVIVLGNVYGDVSAGVPRDENAYIVARSFESDDISVAGYTDPEWPAVGSGIFNRLMKKDDFECACIFHGSFVVESLKNGILTVN